MEAPLNLTPARGPSVWNKPPTIEEPWRAAAAAAGFFLLSAGWPYRSRTARMTGALGLIGLVLGMRCERRVPAAGGLDEEMALRAGEGRGDHGSHAGRILPGE